MSFAKFIVPVAVSLIAAAGFAVADPSTPAPATGDAPNTTTVTVTAPAPQAAVDPNLDPDKVICKREEMTGTRVTRWKICMTRREWETRGREASTDTREWQHDQDLTNKNMPTN